MLVVALLAAFLAVACTATESISPTPSPSSSAAPSRPAASVPPSPIPTGTPAGGIEAYPLGVLRGEYGFVLNGGAITNPGAIAEMWAIPLAGGEPRLAVRYVNATTPFTATGDNALAQQLSPDGRRVVLSVVTPRSSGGQRLSLVIVELETGRTRMVGSDNADSNERPVWSPDGHRIAYIRRPDVNVPRGTTGGRFDDGIWLMNVDGTSARQVIPPGGQGSASHLYGWTTDGRIASSYTFEQATLTLTDIISGVRTRIGSFIGDPLGRLSFRSAVPRIAGSFTDLPNCLGTYVLIADGAPERILVREPDKPNCPNVSFGNVRWNPTRDEVIYLRGVVGKNELYIHELSGATQRVAAQAEPLLAEWSAAGTHLLYVHANAQEPYVYPLHGAELRYVRRDGSDERMIFAPRGPASLSDLAVRLYP